MIEGGYILQPRKFDESEAANFPPITREIWFYLLRNANHKSRKGIDRGQIYIKNLDEIREALCWYVGYRKMMYSKSQVTKSLRRLCESNMTEKRRTTRGLVITISKYELYQEPRNYQGNDEGSAKETRRKRDGHPVHKNDKECNNEKNKERDSESEKPKPPSGTVNGYSDKFLTFWAAYPRKIGKAIAWKAWKKGKLDSLSEKIMLSLDAHKQSTGWTKDNGKYIPHGSTWINQQRWEDEIVEEVQQAKNTPPPRRYNGKKTIMEER